MSRLMAVVATTLVVGVVTISLLRPSPGDLPFSGQAPAFTLVDSGGGVVTDKDVAGRPWVADFIFTKCPGMCPLLSAQMQRVQAAMQKVGNESVQLLSFSVDPTNDTPAALAAYADRFGADPKHWRFLTGDREDLYDVARGFQLAVAEREEDTDGQGLITHSDRFVLVDGDGHIRGYYLGTDPAAIDQLIGDLAKLDS